MSSSTKKQQMTERQIAAAKEAKKLKYYTLTFWVVIVLVVGIFISAILSNPVKNVVYKNTDAVTVGEHTLSAVELNYFYIDAINVYTSQYGDYLDYIMDTSKPLNEQIANSETKQTWADSFMQSAKQDIKSTYALYDLAVKNGHKLSEDEQKAVDSYVDSIALYAQLNGFNSADAYLRAMYGNGSTLESYRKYYEICKLADSYYVAYANSMEYDDAALREYEKDFMYKYSSYTYATYYLAASSFYSGSNTYANATAEEKAAAIAAAKVAAEELEKGVYSSLDEFDAAIKALKINENSKTASSVKNEDILYSKLNSLFSDWLIGKVAAKEEGEADTYEQRKEGDLMVIPYTTGSGDKQEINGYYVVRYGSVNDNRFALKNVRHLLIGFEGGKYDSTTGQTTYTEAEKQKASEKIQAIFKEWEASDKTEATFIAMANKNSTDPGSNTNGGLYEDIYPGQMWEQFEDWCYAASRKAGDYGLVETPNGYHLMFFVGNSDVLYRDFMIEKELRNVDAKKWHDDLTEAMKLEILTDKYVELDMVLGGHHHD